MFRPDSPPPRQPSPDFLPAPLPYPHHPRRIQSQPKIRVHTPTPTPTPTPNPAVPPGLTATLHSARSYDCMSTARSTQTYSARLPISSPSSPASSGRNSPALPSLSSRSSSPGVGEQVPPVPLLPYRYTGPQHIICPRPVPVSAAGPKQQFLLTPSDQIQITVVPASVDSLPRRTALPVPEKQDMESKYTTPPPPPPSVPPLEKHKSMGIACLKFFGLRSPSTRQPRTAMAAM